MKPLHPRRAARAAPPHRLRRGRRVRQSDRAKRAGRRPGPHHARRGRHRQLCQAARSAGHACRARSDREFRGAPIEGTATLDIDRSPDARQIVLDDNGLEIARSSTAPTTRCRLRSGAKDPNLGSPLAIALRPDTKRIVDHLQERARCRSTCCGSRPSRPPGKKAPFLFNQGESIENRSWIPTQDSPGDPPDLGSDDPRRQPA